MKKWLIFILIAIGFIGEKSHSAHNHKPDFMHFVSVWLNDKEVGRAFIEGANDTDRFDVEVMYFDHNEDTISIKPQWCGGGPEYIKIELEVEGQSVTIPDRWGRFGFIKSYDLQHQVPITIPIYESWMDCDFKGKTMNINLWYVDEDWYGKDTVFDPVGSISFK